MATKSQNGEATAEKSDRDIADEKFTFGIHRGKKISDVPLDYLVWAAKKCGRLNEEFRGQLTDYLSRPEFASDVPKLEKKLEATRTTTSPHISFSLPGGNSVDLRLLRPVSSKDFEKIIEGIKTLAAMALIEE